MAILSNILNQKKLPEYLQHSYGVILAGGGGTRLWPKSRQEYPKQFLKLTSEETMIQLTAERLAKIISWKKIIVVTNKLHEAEVIKQLPKIPKENIIAEPEKKDTALAMLIGTLYAKQKDPKAVIINAASDHVVPREVEYRQVMRAAAKTAFESPMLVTVGITPTYPATGFGYIKIERDLKRLAKGLSLFKVESFTEKPNEATAKGFLATGKFYWNANMYVWAADTLIEAFKKYQPKTHELVQPLLKKTKTKFHSYLKNIYKKAESISIDYAISEKADNLVLIPGDFGWDDVGDWKVVYELGKKDSNGNVIITDKDTKIINYQTNNSLIHANGRMIATAGLKDMIIVDTQEILMIVPKSKSQDVKKIVEKLKAEKLTKYL